MSCVAGQKTIDMESAVALSSALISESRWPLIAQWVRFLEAQKKGSVTKDTWRQLPVYMTTVRADLSNHEDNGESKWMHTCCYARAARASRLFLSR